MPDVPRILGDIGKAAFSYLKDAAINSIDGLIPDFSNMVGNVGGGVQQWSGVASQALMMTGQYSPSNLNSLLYQMQTESGGNPRAQNNWDINAMMGTPSKGLMQVIDPTFQAHKMPGYGNIWNPLDNILASIRYAVSRYGSLNAAYRGVGYADGGIVNEPGVYPLAENGWPEFVIPTEPSKRSNAMKLLALGGKRIQGD
ncbi:transglycosylase SLT domain-containing protein, partial [Salmonella enterica]|uniref:lytic transglycosylase domain-containing protein n=1 Tax=Salmonella enterica TaxID=28901 RepID=UPI001BAFC23B